VAKPATDLPEAAAVRALVDGEGRLAVRVTPGARVMTCTAPSAATVSASK